MPFYRDHIYPYLVDILGDPPPIQTIRQKMIPLAYGKVLEIGVGSGANLIHYVSRRVSQLYALEPNPGLVRLAKRRLQQTNLRVEFLDLPGEQIPLEDNTVDTVVSTFTLCTIPGIVEAIQGIARVLKPDGKLIFIEIGLSPDPAVQRRQQQLESSLVVSGFVFDTRYSSSTCTEWLYDRANRNSVLSSISQVIFLLLVGYGDWESAMKLGCNSFLVKVSCIRETPPNTACTGRLGLCMFLEIILSLGSFLFPSLSLPSRR